MRGGSKLGSARYGGFHDERRVSLFGRLLRVLFVLILLAAIAGAVAAAFVEIPAPIRAIETPVTLPAGGQD